MQRRGKYFDKLHSQIGSQFPDLVQLISQCLHNAPNHRPNAENLLLCLQGIRKEVDGQSGSIQIKSDNVLERIKLVHELMEKEEIIKELKEKQVHNILYALAYYEESVSHFKRIKLFITSCQFTRQVNEQ